MTTLLGVNAPRVVVMASLAAGFVALTPALASAHIEPNLSAVPAGKPATVDFNVEHGCGDDGTTQLAVQIPAGITDAAGVAKDGWTAATEGDVVTFTGGPQDAHTPTDFGITFTAPSTEGTELKFPIVQSCGTQEVAWIEDETGEHPAPVVTVGPSDAEPTTAAPDDDEGTADEGGDTGATTTSIEVGHDDATTTTRSATGTSTQVEDDDDGSGATPVVVAIVVAVVVIGGGALVIRARRS
jgi:uncharacterized protein YcnI